MKKGKLLITALLIFTLIGNTGYASADSLDRRGDSALPPPPEIPADRLENAQHALNNLMDFKNQIELTQFQTNLQGSGTVTEFESDDPLVRNFWYKTNDGANFYLKFTYSEGSDGSLPSEISIYDSTFDWEIILKIVDGKIKNPNPTDGDPGGDPGDDILDGEDDRDPFTLSMNSGFDMASDAMMTTLLPNVSEIKMAGPGVGMPMLPESKPRLTITIEQTPKQAASFLSSLNLSTKVSQKTENGKGASFSELRQVIKHFEAAQETAFRSYVKDSNQYYAQLKETLETTGFAKDVKGLDKINEMEARRKIDRQVEDILRDPVPGPQSEKIDTLRNAQKALYTRYLEPSQQHLKEVLESNLTNFHDKIAQLFDGGQTTVESKGGVTEILLYLTA